MQFHLGFTPEISDQKISHREQVLMIGSCFSEHIYDRLFDLKFDAHSNPFGIIFNPESICHILHRIIDKRYFTVSDIFEKDDQFYSFECHSSFSSDNAKKIIKKLNDIVDNWHEWIKTSKFLIITFGTAYAYWHLKKKDWVANCHKFPAATFKKRLLSSTNIVDSYTLLLNKLLVFNPKINVVLTVSPVKHLRDGVVENNLSKANLIQATHQLIANFSHCHYFASYELVNDDLRDYRFYETDMAHPNKIAIEYVWDKFIEVYFTEETKKLNQALTEINKAMNHNPFNSESQAHIQFKHNYLDKCKALSEKYSWLDLKKEIDYFSH